MVGKKIYAIKIYIFCGKYPLDPIESNVLLQIIYLIMTCYWTHCFLTDSAEKFLIIIIFYDNYLWICDTLVTYIWTIFTFEWEVCSIVFDNGLKNDIKYEIAKIHSEQSSPMILFNNSAGFPKKNWFYNHRILKDLKS